ncbi:MAG: iron-containing alcohol dehydrogenase [Phycisphaerae bacterium]|nr:iron-containing alcohol dehydrogenase [Phycisphaerae bacterium]
MKVVTLQQPKRIVFGAGSAPQAAEEVAAMGARRVLVVTSPPVLPAAKGLLEACAKAHLAVTVYGDIDREPTVAMFRRALEQAKAVKPQAVVGVGGGSALDVAKVVAALWDSRQDVTDAFGQDKLTGRATPLVCLPTTSGTGSEVSPNALLVDDADGRKKAVVSPHLVPDAVIVDPLLAVTMPPETTAATGMDALVHCIEAYANAHAHVAVDLYALEGVRLIAGNLARAVEHGDDVAARSAMSLGSLYGGLCQGPVNTAAVHALAYPLGEMYHVPHGLANAVLLAEVMEFNSPAAPQRYADVARALGAEVGRDDLETARAGIRAVRELSARCGVARRLGELGVPAEAITPMAEAAMKVTRLLVNNLRPVTQADAESIYRKAY